MRFTFAAVILAFAVVALPALPRAAPGDVTAVPDITAGQRAQALIDRFSDIYRNTFSLLEDEFPEDHARLMEDLAGIGASRADRRTLDVLAFDRLAEVRRSYGDLMPQAPPLAHSVMLGHLASLYDAVYAGEGPLLCARVARDGSAVLFQLGLAPKYADALDRQSFTWFEAVLLARRTPVERIEAVTAEDWSLVFQVMAASGASRAQMDVLSSGDPAHPEICPALARLLRTTGVIDAPAGLRARSDFARNLAGY